MKRRIEDGHHRNGCPHDRLGPANSRETGWIVQRRQLGQLVDSCFDLLSNQGGLHVPVSAMHDPMSHGFDAVKQVTKPIHKHTHGLNMILSLYLAPGNAPLLSGHFEARQTSDAFDSAFDQGRSRHQCAVLLNHLCESKFD